MKSGLDAMPLFLLDDLLSKYVPPPVTLELLRVRPALEPEPEGSLPAGTPADKVEVTVELFGIPLLPPPLPPLEWSGNLSRSQRTEPKSTGKLGIKEELIKEQTG